MENVRIAILNAYDKVCGYMDNQAPESLHYYSDELHQYLKGSANTYSFRCNARHEDSVYLTEGNKLAFRYRGKDYYLNIMRVTRNEDEVEVEAYSLNFELLNEQKEAYKATSAMTFKQYLDVFDYEKVIVLGINEVSDKAITHEWTGTETMLARIFSLANVFGAEVEFVPELNQDHSLKRIVLNVYKEHTDTVQGIGTDRTDMVLRYGKNVSGITKTSDITEMYTAIRPIGRNGLTVSSINKTEYDADGKIEYTCPAGKRNIYAVQARDRFPSNLLANENERYIAQVWEYDTDNVNVLYGQALAQLKKNCVPQVSYEVEGYFDTDIGDTVTISDQEYTPELYLQARVTEQQRSFTDPTQNKTTFSNFKELQSQIDPALIQKMNQMIEANKVYTCSILTDNGIVFRNGEGSTILTASVMDVGKDMTDSLKIQWYSDNEKLSTGKSIVVKATDFTGKAVYRYEAKDKNDTIRGCAEVTVANLNDGEPGKTGDSGSDAYSLYLTTTSHVFNADCEGNLAKNISVSTVVVGYKGTRQLNPVIGKIPEVDGLGYSISGSTITITAVKGSALADNGTVDIPVTLDGIECTLTFSYAKTKDGYHGENARLCTITGNQIMKYESGSSSPVPESLTLTAEYQNTTHGKWQYRNALGVWTDFVPVQTKTVITIPEDSAAWVGSTAVLRAVDTTQTAMDTITLAKLRDGDKGDTGTAGTGYTLLLSNESYTFAGGVSAAIAGSTSTGVVAYKNTAQVAATVTKIGSTAVSGNATGVATGFAGLTADVSGNGTTSCKITFNATTALVTKNGSVAITITVDGKSFTKDFSFSLALKGEPGKGEKGDPTGIIESATEPATKYTGMLWKHTGTVSGLIKNGVYRWTGTNWDLFLFIAENIHVDNLSAISANLGDVTAGSIDGVSIKGRSKIEIQSPKDGGIVWILSSNDGVHVRQFNANTVLIGETQILPGNILVNDRSIVGDIYELNQNLQSGNFTNNDAKINTNTKYTAEIVFDKSFTRVPVVVCNAVASASACWCYAASITKTGFTLTYGRDSNNNTSVNGFNVRWIAMA